MPTHLRFKNKVVNYDAVESWEIISMHGLFGGHSGYALHIEYSGTKKGPDSWDRVAINHSKESLETLLTSILTSVSKGEAIISIPWDGIVPQAPESLSN